MLIELQLFSTSEATAPTNPVYYHAESPPRVGETVTYDGTQTGTVTAINWKLELYDGAPDHPTARPVAQVQIP